MAQNPSRQVELVLENRQVMGVFLVMAVLCGIFFALGFVVGRNTMTGGETIVEVVDDSIPPGEKPSALPSPTYIPRSQQTVVAGEAASGASAEADLSFYNNVETNAPDGPGETAAEQDQSAASAPPVGPPPNGIIVQVSALTRREDAESLLTLLKEKQLPVLVTTSSNDTLFHVVIGPYKTDKEAEQAKQALEKDGFRPFIRR